MKKIGIISDTHGCLDTKVFEYFKNVDEIWHAGDIGTTAVTDQLKDFKPLKAVYGNIDGTELRAEFPLEQKFEIEHCKIYIVHIAGGVGKYNKQVLDSIKSFQPDILVCGHSHICKVMRDEKYNLLYMNSGAAGVHGFHNMRTLLRFSIENGTPKNLEVIELGPRSYNWRPDDSEFDFL